MLQINNIDAGYGKKKILSGVSLNVDIGELVALMGPNGTGKTTTLLTISGFIHPTNGEILFNNENIAKRQPFENVRKGISMVPQGGKVFKPLSVLDNLEMGGYLLKRKELIDQSLEMVFNLFPILNKRRNQLSETLSGGEQQMLAIGRGLMNSPALLLLDEPSAGLAPLIMREVMKAISNIKYDSKKSILIVEQNVNEVLNIADRAYGLKMGIISFHDKNPRELLNNDKLIKDYLT